MNRLLTQWPGPFPFDSECFSRARLEKNKPPLGGVNDTGDQYD